MTEQQRAPEPRGTRIETRIAIDAPPEAIWALLANVGDWSRWNPLYAEASGVMAVGEVLRLSVVLPGLKPQPADSVVQWIVRGVGVHFQSVSMGGMVLGNRYVLVEPAGEGRSTLINGEVMGGLGGRVIAALMGGKVRAALESMNTGLKAEAEKA